MQGEPDRWYMLGERYWAMGLPAAARHAFETCLANDAASVQAAAHRLLEMALARGDIALAEKAAARGGKLALAKARMLGQQFASARMLLAQVLDGRGVTPIERAAALLGLAHVAAATSDPVGERALLNEAFSELVIAAANAADLAIVDLDDVAGRGVALALADDWWASLDLRIAGPALPAAAVAQLHVVRSSLAAARFAILDAPNPEAVALLQQAAEASGAPSARLRALLIAHRVSLGLSSSGPAGAAEVIAEISALLQSNPELSAAQRAQGWLAVAAHSDRAGAAAASEAALRHALACRPADPDIAARLALSLMDRGEFELALSEIERALRIDSEQPSAWRHAARMFDSSAASAVVIGRLLDAAAPGAALIAKAAPRLIHATAEFARNEVLAGVHAHGHRVKNVLGILGARARSARKAATAVVDEGLQTKLRDLESEIGVLYQEWAEYLRSMQKPVPAVERVDVGALLSEVVAAANARCPNVPIALNTPALVPEIAGDRTMLREALLNIVNNAAEACQQNGGTVTIDIRIAGEPGAAPTLVLEIRDTGPGIPRTLLPRLFAPGFTTKENGSGIGLAIAERVVTAHRGRIALDPNVGGGTVVAITLPSEEIR
ncbi:MAG: hypothetical protein KBG15_20955 [Kofleriaceae bacterium]|nr:hypothetical protein [Kofleriaceae bacterium]